jgi:ankyrin repeat protein
VHLACAQGAIDIVKLMFNMQPAEKMQCLASCDVQKMTPLHCAAMFDHPEIVEYLISEVRTYKLTRCEAISLQNEMKVLRMPNEYLPLLSLAWI